MGIFVRCEWSHKDERPIGERIKHAAGVFASPAVQNVIGLQWYHKAFSKGAALSKPVPLSEFADVRTWRRSLLEPGIYMYGLEVWNGRDRPASLSVSATLQSPSERTSPHFSPNSVVISEFAMDQMQPPGEAWQSLLACAGVLAEEFKGRALISSDELWKYGAEKCGIQEPGSLAYAVFWGGNGSAHHTATMIACKTWDEVQTPDCARLHEAAALLKK
jgi:hypothetical protein